MGETTPTNKKFTLNSSDVMQIAKWMLAPNLLIFLIALNSGQDVKVAAWAAGQGIISTAIYTIKKWLAE